MRVMVLQSSDESVELVVSLAGAAAPTYRASYRDTPGVLDSGFGLVGGAGPAPAGVLAVETGEHEGS